MPKVRDAIRVLERDGWYLARTRGSHRQFKHATKRGTVTVPGKPSGDVAPGTWHGIHEAGWTQGRALTMQYRIRYERSPRNYCAWSPDLLGCVTVGDTLEECRREMREAIAFHLDGLAEDGDVRARPTGYLEILDFPPEPAAVRVNATRAKRPGPAQTKAQTKKRATARTG